MQKEHVSVPPKSRSFNTFEREHREEGQETEGIRHDMNKLSVRPVPTLSIDDTTKTKRETEKTKVFGNSTAIRSETSSDTEDAISTIHTIGEMESLDPQQLPPFRSLKLHANTTDEIGHRGHAHDPLEDQLYLYIGPSTFSGTSSTLDDDGTFVPGDDTVPVVSESPGAADVDIYETAYRDEIERIMARAKEEKREPNVYLTRRVDAKLMAISGLAGKWAAMGEEAKNQIKDYTQFSARRARVTEVSRALRQAAREEYERRRQERRELIAAEKAARAKGKEEEASKPGAPASPPPTEGEIEETMTGSPQSMSRQSAYWKGKAVDKGRQARTSIMGLMDMVKKKSRTGSRDEES